MSEKNNLIYGTIKSVKYMGKDGNRKGCNIYEITGSTELREFHESITTRRSKEYLMGKRIKCKVLWNTDGDDNLIIIQEILPESEVKDE